MKGYVRLNSYAQSEKSMEYFFKIATRIEWADIKIRWMFQAPTVYYYYFVNKLQKTIEINKHNLYYTDLFWYQIFV